MAFGDCPAGSYVAQPGSPTADRVCAACPGGSFSGATNSESCAPWTICQAGTYVSRAPSASSDRGCTLCPARTQTSGANEAVCTPVGECPAGTTGAAGACASCSAGEYCAGGSTPAVPCTGEQWDDDGNPATACVPRAVCGPGTFVARAGNALADRLCSPCAAGTFSPTSNSVSCYGWSTCAAGTFVANLPTAASDRQCVPCAAGSYAALPNQSECLSAAACAAGTVQVTAGTSTAPAVCAPCVAGEHCAGGLAVKLACADDTFDHDRNPATACIAKTLCAAGSYVADPGSATSDRICSACPSGTYTTSTNAAACATWTDCSPGTYVANPPSATADRQCALCKPDTYTTQANQSLCLVSAACPAGEVETSPGSSTSRRLCTACAAGEFCAGGGAPAVPCPEDTWDDDGQPATACVAKTVCGSGSFVAEPGSPTTDRACSPCPTGTLSTTTNAASCTAWADCQPGTHVANVPGPTVDRLCEACAAGTYSSVINQDTCIPVGQCAAGTVQTAAGTPTSPAVCDPCSAGVYCAGGTAPVVPCGDGDFDHDSQPGTACQAWTQCLPGTWVSTAGSALVDRACTGCASGHFSDESNAASCTVWSTCQPGSYVSVSGSALSNRECTDCSAGHYSSGTNAPECTPWTVCTALISYEAVAGTATTDRMCSPCPAGCAIFCKPDGACCGSLYAEESFADNSKGWALGPNWQIGPAQPWTPGYYVGYPDPETDHSPTDDNGTAGVVLGGVAPEVVGGPFYLTSPAVDISSGGPAILEFYRWLNSDYPPFMSNSVEVFDGTTWVTIWSGPPDGLYETIEEASWQWHSFDVTPYRSASFQVRFGYQITSEGVYSIGSWNLDDIRIIDAATCDL